MEQQDEVTQQQPADDFGNPQIGMYDLGSYDEPSISARYMAGDLTKYLLGILKNRTVLWNDLTVQEQAEHVSRVQHAVLKCTRRAAEIIAAEECVNLSGVLGKFVITEKGIKGDFTIIAPGQDRHKLFDMVGKEILVVLPQYELALGGEARYTMEVVDAVNKQNVTGDLLTQPASEAITTEQMPIGDQPPEEDNAGEPDGDDSDTLGDDSEGGTIDHGDVSSVEMTTATIAEPAEMTTTTERGAHGALKRGRRKAR